MNLKDIIILFLAFLSTFIVGIIIGENNCKPTAMEVHQDKTEVEYTIRNGEVLDSIIVYKKQWKKNGK